MEGGRPREGAWAEALRDVSEELGGAALGGGVREDAGTVEGESSGGREDAGIVEGVGLGLSVMTDVSAHYRRGVRGDSYPYPSPSPAHC